MFEELLRLVGEGVGKRVASRLNLAISMGTSPNLLHPHLPSAAPPLLSPKHDPNLPRSLPPSAANPTISSASHPPRYAYAHAFPRALFPPHHTQPVPIRGLITPCTRRASSLRRHLRSPSARPGPPSRARCRHHPDKVQASNCCARVSRRLFFA